MSASIYICMRVMCVIYKYAVVNLKMSKGKHFIPTRPLQPLYTFTDPLSQLKIAINGILFTTNHIMAHLI